MDWETIIGLEIHAELNTKSKLFSSAPNRFGDEPNTNISEVCTGQPGALPILNKEAVQKAILFGLAVNAKVEPYSQFDRKSYFYPDSPRNFQITQFYKPILSGGKVIAEVDGKEMLFAIHHAHLEDDAGMLKHFSDFAGVDYNRAGVPLIEIVSMPCIHSPKEAVAYATAVRAILQYTDVCDCSMEEGSLRMDVNVSVRKKGEDYLRNKIEIKNMNSFSFMEKALESEIKRQIRLYEQHANTPHRDVIPQSTYRWDPEKKEAVLMRSKEYSDDYRYFPEPDLVPIMITNAQIEEMRKKLPELPLQREKRYVQELNLSPDTAFFLTGDKPTADFFEEALAHTKNARALANWIIVEFAGRLKRVSIAGCGLKAAHIGSLVSLIDEGMITGKIAKKVADAMIECPGKDPKEIVAENPDFQPMDPGIDLEPMIDQVLADNPGSISDYKAGKEKAFAYLVGQVMKITRGKASPQQVNELIRKKIF